MKRKDIISKLINEGFTEKTLINMTDNQLHLLSDRIFSEQVSKPILNIPNTDVAKITDAKNKKQTFVTYEEEMSEDVSKEKKKNEEKDIVLKRINYKIESKMKKDECVKSEVELLKRMGEKIPEKVQKYCDARKKKVKEPALSEQKEKITGNTGFNGGDFGSTLGLSGSAMPDVYNAKKWVNKLVENKFFTSKNEILELIKTKINEQNLEYENDDEDIDVATAASPQTQPSQPEIEPDVKPGKPHTEPEIDPDNPFRDPNPDVNPNPKAGDDNEIYATVAKNKIIDLMKKSI